jgi:hypothetical protein
MNEKDIAQWCEQLPEEYRNLKWDGCDVLPFEPTQDVIVWLYRAACLAVDGMYPGPRS